MNKTFLFTIIITCYNTNELLTRCLDSLLDIKKNNNVEIIVVDDGSKNTQKQFVTKHFLTNKNFSFIRQKNLGPGGARNTGIREARGRYAIFIDGDDYVDAKTLLEFINNFEKKYKNSDFDLIRVGYHRFKESSKISKYNVKSEMKFTNFNNYINNVFFKQKFLAFALYTHIYNIDFIKANKLYFDENNLVEDFDHFLKSSIYVRKILASNYNYYYYDNTNPNSITNSKRKKMAHDIEQSWNNCRNNLNSNKLKCFLVIWYLFSFLPKYRRTLKGFGLYIFLFPILYVKK